MSFGQQPDHWGPPPEKKTGVIIGVVAAVVVLAGVVTAVILLTGDDDSSVAKPPGPARPAPSSTGSAVRSGASGGPGSAAKDGRATPLEAAEAVAQGYTKADRQALRDLLCVSAQQTFPDVPPGIVMTVSGDPQLAGDSAVVPVHATGPVKYNDFQLGLEREGGVWCYAADKTP